MAEKLEALARESRDLDHEVMAISQEWELRLLTAERLLLAAELTGGIEQVERVAALTPHAVTSVSCRRTLGISHPAEIEVAAPPSVATPWANTSALAFAAEAYRRALDAGARYAATLRAWRILEREQIRTTRRLRSIERRWIPQLGDSLRDAARALDEAEREDTVRISWVARGGP